MKRSGADLTAITCALRRPDTVLAAVQALHGIQEPAAVDGLVELLYRAPPARAGAAAIAALEGCTLPQVQEALLHALDDVHATVRLAAVEALQRRGYSGPALQQVLRQDESWPVRRAALRALAVGPERSGILLAADDPHWRVRHALIEVLLQWGATGPTAQDEIERSLSAAHPRCAGLRCYLRYRWTGATPVALPAAPLRPITAQPFWDWDAFVLHRNLERLSEGERKQALDWLPELLIHSDERVAGFALDTLRRWGEAPQFAAALALLEEPRSGSRAAVTKLLATLDEDQLDDTAELLQAAPQAAAARAWASTQQLPVVRSSPDTVAERSALAEELLRTGVTAADERLLQLQADPHPLVRAAALTPSRAAELVRDPGKETSWQVLAKAARLMKTPLWKLEPERWQPTKEALRPAAPLQPRRSEPPQPRLLGPTCLPVAPLGVSGHYGLPVAGFVRAVEAGVNLLFWEPNYATLTEFAGRLSPADRGALHFIAGTFEADGQRIERDAERALRLLRLERLSLFLLFWVQGWNRITPDVRDSLDRLQQQGKIGVYGLSTHSRPLALDALRTGWNPVMVRHSVAHRGAEVHVLPQALASGTSIITFNNTCYSRLLKASDSPSAADCYRYTLAQPGVTACLSAPATLEQLEENLLALHEPDLAAERREELLRHGAAVYREDTLFRQLVRER